ncbi:hypothetical protein HZH66_002540 [Vespula vulgaris]|uniref:Sidoreflexin n=1 Tax=Vespula vulgaris TaxID=7454 RepID=A0A834NHV1_VESVU|nr:hypothetical protein HZH66_002540 [Vespula vulgaris]
MSNENRIDIEKPYWDQNTFRGRALHFLTVTNPLNVFAPNKALEHARNIVTKYRNGETLAKLGINEEELWKQKYLFDSAYHPDTGEKMIIIGRMSAQVPMNMTITGLMMTFYKSTPAVIFWQWFNQSFNAIVNYTNRSGKTPIPKETLIQSYIGATGGAVITALSLNRLARHGPALVGRLVPLAAVAAANCVNIPLMRITELQNVKWASAPIQVIICGICLTFATPLCCALFVQRVPISVDKLEPEVQEEIRSRDPDVQTVYYNKGL